MYREKKNCRNSTSAAVLVKCSIPHLTAARACQHKKGSRSSFFKTKKKKKRRNRNIKLELKTHTYAYTYTKQGSISSYSRLLIAAIASQTLVCPHVHANSLPLLPTVSIVVSILRGYAFTIGCKLAQLTVFRRSAG